MDWGLSDFWREFMAVTFRTIEELIEILKSSRDKHGCEYANERTNERAEAGCYPIVLRFSSSHFASPKCILMQLFVQANFSDSLT